MAVATPRIFSLRGMALVFAVLVVVFSDITFATKVSGRGQAAIKQQQSRRHHNRKRALAARQDACPATTEEPVPTGVENPPVKYGMVLYQSFEIIDVFGPIQILNMLSRSTHLEMTLISPNNDTELVTSEPVNPRMNPMNSTIWPAIQPDVALTDAPTDLDVLIIPGGLGTRSPYINGTIDYVRDMYPSLQYVLSICTGASVAARAGVLDGKRATTSKSGWSSVVGYGKDVDWVEEARWVVDGNVWSSSGLSAGMDATLAFVDAVYGRANSTSVANSLEYNMQLDSTLDPFSKLYDLSPAPQDA